MPGVNPPSLPENYDVQFEMCKGNDTPRPLAVKGRGAQLAKPLFGFTSHDVSDPAVRT